MDMPSPFCDCSTSLRAHSGLAPVITLVFFVEPAVKAFGDTGERFLAHVAIRQRFVAVLVIAAITTAVAGVLLYWIDSGGLSADWFASHAGLGFTAGAIAGFIALLIPGFAFRPTIARLATLAKDGNTPRDAASERSIEAIDARFRRWSLLQAGLLVFAIAAMATARYLP